MDYGIYEQEEEGTSTKQTNEAQSLPRQPAAKSKSVDSKPGPTDSSSGGLLSKGVVQPPSPRGDNEDRDRRSGTLRGDQKPRKEWLPKGTSKSDADDRNTFASLTRRNVPSHDALQISVNKGGSRSVKSSAGHNSSSDDLTIQIGGSDTTVGRSNNNDKASGHYKNKDTPKNREQTSNVVGGVVNRRESKFSGSDHNSTKGTRPVTKGYKNKKEHGRSSDSALAAAFADSVAREAGLRDVVSGREIEDRDLHRDLDSLRGDADELRGERDDLLKEVEPYREFLSTVETPRIQLLHDFEVAWDDQFSISAHTRYIWFLVATALVMLLYHSPLREWYLLHVCGASGGSNPLYSSVFEDTKASRQICDELMERIFLWFYRIMLCGGIVCATRVFSYFALRLQHQVRAIDVRDWTVKDFDYDDPRDLRPDSIATVKLKHQRTRLWPFMYRTAHKKFLGVDIGYVVGWMLPGTVYTEKLLWGSFEMIAQLATQSNIPMGCPDNLAWERLNYAARSLSTVNYNRYSVLDKRYVVQDSVFICYALHKHQADERSLLPFPRPPA